MVKKSGLGKGLDSLIPSAGAKKSNPAKPEVKKEVVVEKVVKKEEVMLKITEVEPNREQPRKNFNEDALLELAERVSKSRTAVTNSMRLLKLDERVQQMVVDEKISTGHARALLAVEDKEQQYTLANKIFDEKLSVRETERLMKNFQKEKENKKSQKTENEFIYKGIEEKIKMILGTKVTVNHKKNNKGRIEIEYYSNEELERIMDLLESIHQEA